MHDAPTGQAAPQAPQLKELACVSTQAPLQLVSVPQPAEQAPARHTSDAPHAAPHAPQ